MYEKYVSVISVCTQTEIYLLYSEILGSLFQFLCLIEFHHVFGIADEVLSSISQKQKISGFVCLEGFVRIQVYYGRSIYLSGYFV